ncbi:MAG: ABC transporter ATP-binding protein [Lachnospiraceae bacterium]|nr:ABC transporter ATP-binding protein [Lachnospiraceae bacterium]
MKAFFKYMKPYMFFFILGPLLMLSEVIADVQLPNIVTNMIKYGVATGDKEYVITSTLKMLGIVLFSMAAGVGAAYCAARASVNFACDLRRDLFKKIQTFSFKNIDGFSSGSLITRLTNDITQVQGIINMAMRMMLRSPGMLIGSVIMAYKIEPEMTKVFLVLIPILVLIVAIIIKIAFPRFEKFQGSIDALNTSVQEDLTNVRVIKSLVREDYEKGNFAKTNENLKNSAINAMKIVILQMPIMTLVVNFATIIILYIAGVGVLNKEMDVAVVSAFITYITQILMSLMMLTMIFIQMTRAIASIKRIKAVFNTDVDIDDDEASMKEAVVTNGDIEFRNVSFKYYEESQKEVLDNINLTIKGGETVGIIGSTGCGKSTLVQMIPRLYDVMEGEVLVDGINVKDYKLYNLREGVGMVLQKNVLFSGSIMENLLWGDENATKEEVVKATSSASAHEFIESFTEGYETDLSQGGVNLSGGQKQRLCIARALLKKPKILILDDSTSAVDTATEANIREALKNDLQGSTKIIIAQRISSVANADKIVVMNDGCIEMVGTHEELLANSKTYKEIYDSQMEGKVGA